MAVVEEMLTAAFTIVIDFTFDGEMIIVHMISAITHSSFFNKTAFSAGGEGAVRDTEGVHSGLVASRAAAAVRRGFEGTPVGRVTSIVNAPGAVTVGGHRGHQGESDEQLHSAS
jgi:hypothetical protein